jgi:hypothetical protein
LRKPLRPTQSPTAVCYSSTAANIVYITTVISGRLLSVHLKILVVSNLCFEVLHVALL